MPKDIYNICIYIYIYIYIYTSLPVNAIVRLLYPQSGDSQDQETFLAPSADKQTRNYDTRVLKLDIKILRYHKTKIKAGK